MKDWRNYEHFQCPACLVSWEVYSPHSYDEGDSAAFWQRELCQDCFEEKHQADLAEQEAEEQASGDYEYCMDAYGLSEGEFV